MLALKCDDRDKGENPMEILQVPKARKVAAAYHDGSITLREFMEELERCWAKKIYNGTRKIPGQQNNVLTIPKKEGCRLSLVWEAFYV
jgi:hypothetical protein